MGSKWGEPVPKWKPSICWVRIRGTLCQEGSFFSSFFGQQMLFCHQQKQIAKLGRDQVSAHMWGQLDVRTRMRASKSWNFDLDKPIKPIKMDSCVIFADHCLRIVSALGSWRRKRDGLSKTPWELRYTYNYNQVHNLTSLFQCFTFL